MRGKIDSADRRILFELDRNARIPETRLAKIIGKSKESVRYRIKKLLDQGILAKFTIWIDPTKIGYHVYKMYLLLNNLPMRRKELVAYAKTDRRLFWLGIAEGTWNVGLTFFVKTAQEFYDLKNDLRGRFKDLIIDSNIAQVVGIQIHEKTFLAAGQARWTAFFGESSSHSLDEMSVQILKALFENSRENVATIAYKNKTSVDIVRGRLKRMEAQGIIVKYTIAIDYDLLGYELYKTFVYLKSTEKDAIKRLLAHLLMDKNIIHVVKQISPWDIELETLCENYRQYNTVMSRLTQRFSDVINKIETSIISEDVVFPAKEMVFER